MADSTAEAVGDVAKAGVVALAIPQPGVTPPAPVPCVKRKLPGAPEGNSLGLPQFVVSIDGEGAIRKMDARTDLVSYPVAVTVVTKGGLAAADDPVPRKWREQIRKKLQARATWAALPGFNSVSTVGKPPFDPSALSKDYNYGTLVFTVTVLESRT